MAIRFTRDFLSVFLNQNYYIDFSYLEHYRSDSDSYICTVAPICDDLAINVVQFVLSSLRSDFPSLRFVPDSDFYVVSVHVTLARCPTVKVVLRSK